MRLWIRVWMLFLCGSPALVWASSPCLCPGELSQTLPMAGAVDVPLNTRVVAFGWRFVDASTAELAPEERPAELVDVDASVGTDGHSLTVVPRVDLEPSTRYRLEATTPDGVTSYQVRFTTGTERDDTPPSFASVDVTGGAIGGACEKHTAARVVFEGLAAEDHTTLIEVQITGAVVNTTAFVFSDNAVFGDASAGGTDWVTCLDNAPGAVPGAAHQAQITVYDMAGNATVAPQAVAFEFQSNAATGGEVFPGCCTILAKRPTSAPPWAWPLFALGALGVLTFRRLR